MIDLVGYSALVIAGIFFVWKTLALLFAPMPPPTYYDDDFLSR